MNTEPSTGTLSGVTQIVVIGPFPPPHNGAAKNTQIWAEGFATGDFEVLRIDTSVQSGSAHNRSFAYHLHRISVTLRNALTLLWKADRNTVVYMVPDGGLGLIYNMLYARILSMRGVRRLWMHHRNFYNIKTSNSRLKRLCALIGDRGRHIFLTEDMRQAFEANIAPAPGSHVIGNAATCDIPVRAAEEVCDPESPLTIGFLSNLNRDKGFDIAAESFELVAARHPDYHFLIGGAPTDDEAKRWQDNLASALGSRVEMLGHISGDAKADFFRRTDIFVFPTTYKLEAQPNVLMEALAAGAAIVATDHACIPETLKGSHHRLIDLNEDRAAMAVHCAEALETLAQGIDTPHARRSTVRDNIEAFEAMQTNSVALYEDFSRQGIVRL